MAGRTDVENLLRKKGNQAAEELVGRAARSGNVLAEVMTLVTSSEKRVKNGAAKTLKILGEVRPDLLLPRAQDFIRLMNADDTIVRWIAMDFVGNLAELDRGGALNMKTLRVFLARVSDPSLVTAAHAVDNLGKIGLHKPRVGPGVDCRLRDAPPPQPASGNRKEGRETAVETSIFSGRRMFSPGRTEALTEPAGPSPEPAGTATLKRGGFAHSWPDPAVATILVYEPIPSSPECGPHGTISERHRHVRPR